MKKRAKKKSKKAGISEVVMFLIILFLCMSVLAVTLVITVVNYDMFIDRVISDIRSRMTAEVNIYRYESFNELEDLFERVKSEYAEDFVKFYKGNVLPEKIRENIIRHIELKKIVNLSPSFDNPEINESTNEEDDNTFNGYYMFSISLNMDKDREKASLPVVFFQYSPQKFTFFTVEQNSFEN